MWTNITARLILKIESLGREKQLYIVPTMDGLKLLALNLILLVIGLAYANNYILFFNFILFCLFLASMFYTHFNLQGLRLTSTQIMPIHANEASLLTLHFKTQSSLGHYFLKARLSNPLIKNVEEPTFSFKASENKRLSVDIKVVGIKRGSLALEKICIETLFPFHLFKCFVFFNANIPLIVFPEKKDLRLHRCEVSPEEKLHNGDDFVLNDFRSGDPLKRVHWKKLAQSNRWYSKHLISPDPDAVILSLGKSSLSAAELEAQLCSITFNLYRLYTENIRFGLDLGKIKVRPDCSKKHLLHCLDVLAVYET